MSSDHQDTRGFQPPSATDELHRKLPSSATGNNLYGFTTLHVPQTPSPMTPASNTDAVEANSTPESRLAAALGRAIFNIPSSSFQDEIAAATTINPLLRTLSDADSSVNQDPSTTNATPLKIPTNNPLLRALSDTITTEYQQRQKTRTNKPIRRALSDTTDYQQPPQKKRTPPRVSSSPTAPQSSNGKQSPYSERLRKMEDMIREIEQRCCEIMHEEHVEEENPPQAAVEQEESVGVERLKNGDLRFDLSCSCGKHFEMLIKQNGYCFYRLT